MQLPAGAVDPMFLCDLARDLHMTVAEITHGRGAPMSAHELGVMWPTYFRFHQLERNAIAKERESSRGR